ncbi:MAG: hypothetical protein GC129_05335 [Proteobacteria bacterium]|nr:hypothetical protein [Pseudomonadota bacterium]
MKRVLSVGCWVLGLLLAQQVWAGEVEDVVGHVSAENADMVQAILAQQQKGLGCGDFKLLEIDSVSVLSPPKDATGKEGLWTTRFVTQACGEPVFGNVLFDMRKGPLEMDPLVPGDTRADPQLQADVAKSFAVSTAMAMEKCKDLPKIRSTRVVAPPRENGSWKEVWIGTACGRDMGQMVDFMPTDKGVGFTMTLPKAAKK